jgi:hypothetical protein
MIKRTIATLAALTALAAPGCGSSTVTIHGTLGLWNHDHLTAGGTTFYSCDMPFTISGVPSEPRYGLQVAGVPGTTWTTATTVTLTVNQS